jgi:hypothetical protein
MSAFLAVNSIGRILPGQQTRVSAFLISAHGALVRRLAFTLPGQMKANWQTELNAQLYREAETVSLLMRATSWSPDPELLLLLPLWEAVWLPTVPPEIGDASLAFTIDTAALGHAVHAAIRPAILLPDTALAEDPFVMALRRIEFESGRVMQAQILFLKGHELVPFRDSLKLVVEQRHQQVRELWDNMLKSIGVEREARP